MKNNLKFLLLTALVAIGGLVVIGGKGIQVNNDLVALGESSAQINGEVAGAQNRGEAKLDINFGDKTRQFDFQVDQKTSAYELLKRASLKENLILETKEYQDLGILVDGIGEYRGGTDGKFWLLYVNGQMAQSAIDKTLVKPGDKVELRFEEY